jgi:N-acetylmuramoyl-L-alanine amidase-like protein
VENWYPLAKREALPDSGRFVGGPYRGVLHDTEGSSYAGAKGAYLKNKVCPHFTTSVEGDGQFRVWQHVPLDRAASALAHPSGTIDTNRLSTIQIEVVGFATKPLWSPAMMVGMTTLMEWIELQTGIRPKAPVFRAYPASYGTNNGVRFSDAAWKAFDGWCGHQHVPHNCVTADTPVLCADLTWRPAGDLLPGDELIAFDEMPAEQMGRRFQRAVVTANALRRDALLRVNTPVGSIRCTYDHPWLTRQGAVSKWGRWAWKQARDLRPGDEVMYVMEPWEVDRSWEAGWLAGMFDGEGSLGVNKGFYLSVAQRESPLAEEMLRTLKERCGSIYHLTRRACGPKDTMMVQATVHERAAVLRLLGMVRPHRLLPKADSVWEGGVLGKTAKRVPVESVEPWGTGTIAALGTSTLTYIADGFAMHNTHGDPGAILISELLVRVVTPPPPSPAPVHDYTEASVKTTMIAIGKLDDSGNGWLDYDPALGRDPIIVGCVLHGPSPPDDGYWDQQENVTLAAQPRGGKVRVTVRNGTPGDTVAAWISVA